MPRPAREPGPKRDTFWAAATQEMDPLFDPTLSQSQKNLIEKQTANRAESPGPLNRQLTAQEELSVVHRIFPDSLPSHPDSLSNDTSKAFGGFDFLPTSHKTHRAHLFLVDKAKAAVWLQDTAARALEQQSVAQRHAQ